MDLQELARRSWPWVLARGILVLLFGIAILVWPAKSLEVIAIVFGIYALIDGLASVVTSIMARGVDGAQRWIVGLFGGLLALFGLIAIIHPGSLLVALSFVFAFWALVFGVERIVQAFQLKGRSSGWGWVLGSGVLTVLVGLVLAFWPDIAVVTLAVVIGVGTLLSGVVMIISALALRSASRRTTTIESTADIIDEAN